MTRLSTYRESLPALNNLRWFLSLVMIQSVLCMLSAPMCSV